MDFIVIVSGLSIIFYLFNKRFPILHVIKQKLEYGVLTLFILISIYSYYYDRSLFVKILPYCKNNPFLPGFDTIYKYASKILLDTPIEDKNSNGQGSIVQKRSLSESIKKKVAADQKWNCKQCQSILDATYEIDHIMPLYKGGTNDITNLQALCRNCHGTKTLEDKIKYS